MKTTGTVVDVANDTTTVNTGRTLLMGVYVNTTLSAHTLPIKDDTTTLVTLPASAAAGTHFPLPGILFSTSLIVDPNDAATGNITVAWKPAAEEGV